MVQYLTADLAQNFALEKGITSYKVNNFDCTDWHLPFICSTGS